MQSYNPPAARRRSLGYSHFARHYSGNHYCFLFLPVLRCFSSRGWLSFEYYTFSIVGWPIRKSRDIMLVCSSPWLIAAYHVLHRLSDPRHPPCALICFKKIRYILSGSPHFSSLLSVYNFLFPNMSKNFTIYNWQFIIGIVTALLMLRLRTFRPFAYINVI